MKKIVLCAALLGSWPALGLAQTTQELVNDGKNTENVTTQSMGYDRKSYSPLKQITKANVKRLVPIWNSSLMNDSGELAQPTVYNGVMYVINGKWSFAIDIDTGRQIWRTPVKLEPNMPPRLNYTRGAATIYNGKVFRVTIDNHVLALDMKTGKEVWKATGRLLDMAYGTPSIMEAAGRTDLVFALPDEVWGMNPDTGKLRWYAVHELPGNISPCLIQDGDVAYLFGGFPTQGSAAIKLGGKNDVTATNILWNSKSSSYVPTPILHDGHLYVVNDQGFALCMEAKTGKDIYRERVIDTGGGRGRGKPFYASPVLIGDRLYCVSRKGGTYVIAAKPIYQKLAQNIIQSDETQFNGTPAIVGDRMILRSDWGVYCIAGTD